MKKLLLWALVLCMACSLLSTAALADEYEKRSGPFTYYDYGSQATILDVDSSVSGTLTIPQTLGGKTVTQSMYGAFNDLPYITEVVIPSTFTSFAAADAINPFCGCPNLQNIRVAAGNPVFRFADGILYGKYDHGEWVEGALPALQGRVIIPAVESIRMGAFQGCTQVTDVVLPDGLDYIGWLAFNELSNLRTIYIPASCTWIGMNAFDGCWGLTDVYYGGTQAQWNRLLEEMDSGNDPLLNATVHFRCGAAGFVDVGTDDFFCTAVEWAVDNGVTNGTTPKTFDPNTPCTRAQMITFLWRSQGSPKPKTASTAFRDLDRNGYYYNAVLWAVERGITNGTSAAAFSPDATVTRAQTVTFLWRLEGSPSASGRTPFTDVPAGQYYTTAVVWAVKNGITNGTAATTFSPDTPCTRAQIVTFLYRDLK